MGLWDGPLCSKTPAAMAHMEGRRLTQSGLGSPACPAVSRSCLVAPGWRAGCLSAVTHPARQSGTGKKQEQLKRSKKKKHRTFLKSQPIFESSGAVPGQALLLCCNSQLLEKVGHKLGVGMDFHWLRRAANVMCWEAHESPRHNCSDVVEENPCRSFGKAPGGRSR